MPENEADGLIEIVDIIPVAHNCVDIAVEFTLMPSNQLPRSQL